ncbi:unnamed protein product [Ectocarpus sp. 12 AP-2014]
MPNPPRLVCSPPPNESLDVSMYLYGLLCKMRILTTCNFVTIFVERPHLVRIGDLHTGRKQVFTAGVSTFDVTIQTASIKPVRIPIVDTMRGYRPCESPLPRVCVHRSF